VTDQPFLDEASWRKVPLDAHLEIWERVRSGELLREIAHDYGVTRERIRQIAAAIDSQASEVGQSVKVTLKRERQVVLAEVRAVQQALRNGPCRICGGPVTRRVPRAEFGRTTCGRRCHELWGIVRYTVDDHDRQVQIHNHARWVLRNSTDPVKLRHAKRVLRGTVEGRGRWHQAGSSVPIAMQEVADRQAAVKATGESWWT
jgi:hypothetical protein